MRFGHVARAAQLHTLHVTRRCSFQTYLGKYNPYWKLADMAPCERGHSHNRLWRGLTRCGMRPCALSCWNAAWMCDGRRGPVSPSLPASTLAAPRQHGTPGEPQEARVHLGRGL